MLCLADQNRPQGWHKPERHSVPLERAGWPRSGRAGRDLAGAGRSARVRVERPASGSCRSSTNRRAAQVERCRASGLDDRSSAATPPRSPRPLGGHQSDGV